MIWLILGVILIFWGIMFIVISIDIGTIFAGSILATMSLLLGVLSLKKYKKHKVVKSIKSPEQNIQGKFKHTIGLSIPEDTICTLNLSCQGLKIDSNGVSFNLSQNKILDVTVKTDAEIQKQLVSSTGGAVAGGILFGALGAMIGGRVKEKKITTIKQYLIFVYEKDGKSEYIAFDTTGNMTCIKFMKYFQQNMQKGNIQVNL